MLCVIAANGGRGARAASSEQVDPQLIEAYEIPEGARSISVSIGRPTLRVTGAGDSFLRVDAMP